jgi:hypothetical protein
LWTPRRSRYFSSGRRTVRRRTKHGVLELELRHGPASDEQTQEANEDEVGERSQYATMLPTSVNRTRNRVWSPTPSARMQRIDRTPLAQANARVGRACNRGKAGRS